MTTDAGGAVVSAPRYVEIPCRECSGRGVVQSPCYEDTDTWHCECWENGDPCCRCGDNPAPGEHEDTDCTPVPTEPAVQS